MTILIVEAPAFTCFFCAREASASEEQLLAALASGSWCERHDAALKALGAACDEAERERAAAAETKEAARAESDMRAVLGYLADRRRASSQKNWRA